MSRLQATNRFTLVNHENLTTGNPAKNVHTQPKSAFQDLTNGTPSSGANNSGTKQELKKDSNLQIFVDSTAKEPQIKEPVEDEFNGFIMDHICQEHSYQDKILDYAWSTKYIPSDEVLLQKHPMRDTMDYEHFKEDEYPPLNDSDNLLNDVYLCPEYDFMCPIRSDDDFLMEDPCFSPYDIDYTPLDDTDFNLSLDF